MCDASYTYWLFLIYIRVIRSSILCLREIRAIRSFVPLVFCWAHIQLVNANTLGKK